jgi:hypothetical protein
MLPRIRDRVRRLITASGATSTTPATEAADTDPGPGEGTDIAERTSEAVATRHATALATLRGSLRSDGSGGAQMTFDSEECVNGQPAYPPPPPKP